MLEQGFWQDAARIGELHSIIQKVNYMIKKTRLLIQY